MSSLSGMHVENYHIGEGAADRNAIIGRDGCATMLHLQAAQVYPQIRADLGPDVLIHVRMYQQNWYALDPRKWARDCFDILRGIPGLLDDPRVLITAANEPDLAAEGHPGAATVERPHPTLAVWREIWSWSLAFSSEWRASVRGTRAKLGTTPVAGGHEPAGFPPDYEYQMLEYRQHARDCDAVVVHGYCNRDWSGHSPETAGYWAALRAIRPPGYRERDGALPLGGIPDPGGVAMQIPDKPFLVAEMGNWHHHDAGGAEVESTLGQFRSVYRYLSDTGRCLGGTLFIFNSGDEHRENRFFGNTALIRGLVAMERYPAAEFDGVQPPAWYWPLENMRVTMKYSAAHKAVDLRAPTGTPVYAVSDGDVVASVGEKYGIFLIQSLPGGYSAVGAHLQSVTKVGRVAAGEQIAIADNTGTSTTGAHLHFEIRGPQQERYDPTLFLAERGAILPGSAPVPVDKPLSEQYPREFAEWVAAGGVQSNFGRHIKAIRQDIPITGADVLDAIGGAKAAAEQAALISARYKFT